MPAQDNCRQNKAFQHQQSNRVTVHFQDVSDPKHDEADRVKVFQRRLAVASPANPDEDCQAPPENCFSRIEADIQFLRPTGFSPIRAGERNFENRPKPFAEMLYVHGIDLLGVCQN